MSAEGNPCDSLKERIADAAAYVGVDGAGDRPLTPPGSYWCTP
jgi:hypothetical protein